MTTLKNKKGVSLVELIAVIVIMGIIATVGGISVASIIENSNKAAAQTAVSDVFTAGKNYLQSHLDDDDKKVTLAELVADDSVEPATANKFGGPTEQEAVIVYVFGTKYTISSEGTPTDAAEVTTVNVGNYTVTYNPSNGSFTAGAKS